MFFKCLPLLPVDWPAHATFGSECSFWPPGIEIENCSYFPSQNLLLDDDCGCVCCCCVAAALSVPSCSIPRRRRRQLSSRNTARFHSKLRSYLILLTHSSTL